MGFVGDVMENVKGIQWYYIVGILIFFSLFIVILVRTIRMPKTELVEIKTAILDNDEITNNHTN
jgi:hypothetical protein